jgi:hypothetical protein
MIQVGLLTEHQKNTIEGMHYKVGHYFNPIQDADGNWVVSMEEINGCNIAAFAWVKSLPLIEYKPIEITEIL